MSNKLTFDEWKRRLQDECYNSDCTTDCAGCEFSVDKLSAWNFCKAQEQKEICELKKKVEELENRDINRIFHKSMMNIVELKKKLEKAEEVIRFYGDKENYHERNEDVFDYIPSDVSFENNCCHGGKRARDYLKENV